ncbi:MAG TPA: hypothetical protein VFC10_00265 [Terriglobia bacterium]|nr:hypothetical protein [Terriglobia bacterium]
MKTRATLSAIFCLAMVPSMGRADFKYTRTSQITGGAMAGMVHVMGVFSKQMREPAESTTYVKGDFLRTDESDGTYQIIDVNGKRIIKVDPKKRAYSVVTFEQMREMMEKMQAKWNEEVQKQQKEKGSEVTITPKVEVTPSDQTQSLLGQTAHEVKMKVTFEAQQQNAQRGPQSGGFGISVDSWVAPSVQGYEEVSNLYKKMATEISWNPMVNIAGDPRMRQSMVELYKSGKIPQGLPLLQVINMEVEAQGGSQASSESSQQNRPAGSSDEPTTAGDVAAKAIGGMFGGFGHFGRKKKNTENTQTASSANSAAGPSSTSLMEITSRVTSYSTDPVDSSLFEIPAGYTQVPSNLERDFQRGQ